MKSTVYQDLYDIEKRPGAGVALWTKAVETQLQRVRDVNYRHRLHHSPNSDEQEDDEAATDQLQADVYFLVLVIRRVLLFHDAVAKQISDPRLVAARENFLAVAREAQQFRNFYEHLDEYLVDNPKKRNSIRGRNAPVLHSRWDSDNVVVAFGPERMDATLAAVAAIELGKVTTVVYDEHLERLKEADLREPPPGDEGTPRILEVSFGVSAIIGGDDEYCQQQVATLLDVRVRDATATEISDQPAEDSASDRRNSA